MRRAMVLVLLISAALLTFGVKPAAACGWRSYGYGYGYGAYHRHAYRYRPAYGYGSYYRPRVYGWGGWGGRRGWGRW
jgi:hypothetical protein